MSPRPPLPPFTEETARQKVQAAEDAWNTRDPIRCAADGEPAPRPPVLRDGSARSTRGLHTGVWAVGERSEPRREVADAGGGRHSGRAGIPARAAGADRAMLRAAAALAWVTGLGFGLPCTYAV